MRRRSRAGAEPVKTRHRKTVTRNRRDATKLRGRGTPDRDQDTEIVRVIRERDEAREQQKATAEILRVIRTSPADVQPVFETIVRNAVSLCRSLYANVFRFDGGLLHFAASHNVGLSPAPRANMRGRKKWRDYLDLLKTKYPMRPDLSQVAGRVLLTKSLVQLEDALIDPDYDQRLARAIGSRRLLGVPILREGEPLGVIVAGWAEAGPVPKVQEELLKTFAEQAAIAIENARLLNELRQSLDQQTATSEVLRVISSSPGDLQPVFEAMLQNAVRLCDATFGNIYRWDGDALDLVGTYNTPSALVEARKRLPFRPTGKTPFGRVIAAKKTVHVTNATSDESYIERIPSMVAAVELGGLRTFVAVPMLKEDQLIGILNVFRQEVCPFTDKQISLIENFAAQAVIAIENARLLSELRESLDRQTATADILRVIASAPEDSKHALDTIAETASRMFDVAQVNFRRIEGDVLRIVSFAGPTIERLRKALPDIPLEPTDPAVRCFLDNHQLSVEDRQAVLANERGPIATALRELPVRSQVFTPLSRQGKAIGVMIVARGEVRPFQEHELELMRGFADQAVIAIENARLLSELRDSYRMVQQQAGKLEAQSQELVKLNAQLEQRVADQVGEIERMGRLRRFLPPQVADLIVASGTEQQLESHRREITALFCDLRGFTGFSESSDPEDVMALLRDYHAGIGQIIIKYSGTLERYAGDGVMVVFNDPVPVENPALQAVLMALEMRDAIGALTETWHRWGHDIGFGIGIAHGFATLGTIGFEGRFDYAAIGTVSNVASRLCDEAKPGQILISPRVLTKVENAVTVEPVGEFTLKGIRRPLMAYNVLGSSPSKPN